MKYGERSVVTGRLRLGGDLIREELGDQSKGNGLALLAEHEPTHTVEGGELLDADHLPSHHPRHHNVPRLHVRRPLLLDLPLLRQRRQQLVERNLLCQRGRVHHTREPSRHDGLYLKELHASVEVPHVRQRPLRVRQHEPAVHVLLVDTPQLDQQVVSRQRVLQHRLVKRHRIDYRLLLRRLQQNLILQRQLPRLQLPVHRDLPLVLVLPHDREANWVVLLPPRHRHVVQDLLQATHLVSHPCALSLRHTLLQPEPLQPRQREELERPLPPAHLLRQERSELTDNVVVPVLVPLHSLVVHLVDTHRQEAHPGRLHQPSVLVRLPPTLEPGLELTTPRADHQHRNVRLRRPSDHRRHERLVSGRVQNRVPPIRGLEVHRPRLVRLPLLPLLVVHVKRVRELPTVTPLRLRLPLELFHRPLVDTSTQLHHVSTDRTLPSVNVPDEHNVQVRPRVPDQLPLRLLRFLTSTTRSRRRRSSGSRRLSSLLLPCLFFLLRLLSLRLRRSRRLRRRLRLAQRQNGSLTARLRGRLRRRRRRLLRRLRRRVRSRSGSRRLSTSTRWRTCQHHLLHITLLASLLERHVPAGTHLARSKLTGHGSRPTPNLAGLELPRDRGLSAGRRRGHSSGLRRSGRRLLARRLVPAAALLRSALLLVLLVMLVLLGLLLIAPLLVLLLPRVLRVLGVRLLGV
eukprot:Hpha_TRINITY_DN16024_c3_g3::TRINITY_DN16024_c3_g3_i2::g.122328::m.122328